MCTNLAMMSFKCHSKHLYDESIHAPMDDYNTAMRFYLSGKYWEAGFAFGKVLSTFPKFHINDKAIWYVGDCFTKLYLNEIARSVLNQALNEYGKSEIRSRYVFGLLRLDYQEGKYDDAMKNHDIIVSLYPESEIRTDADYIAGEIQFKRKNYETAERLLSSIKIGYPTFLYAQYTLAIINIECNKKQAAIINLTTIINDSTPEAPDKLLQDAASLKLGHLYFEDNKLRQAVEAYKRVPKGSPYQDEALLGIAWTWMKVNRPHEVIKTVTRLISNCGESSLVPEAFLLKGYTFMVLKQYEKGVNAFKQCQILCNKHFISNEDFKRQTARFDSLTKQFSTIAEKIKINACRKSTAMTLAMRPKLKKEYLQFADENEAFFRYSINAITDNRFLKKRDEIISKATQALRISIKLSARVPLASER
jgi:tetratricopeptide (TPR) repeat protein